MIKLTERRCSAAIRNQRLAVIKSFCRYNAVEQPDLDQVTQIQVRRQFWVQAVHHTVLLTCCTASAVRMLR